MQNQGSELYNRIKNDYPNLSQDLIHAIFKDMKVKSGDVVQIGRFGAWLQKHSGKWMTSKQVEVFIKLLISAQAMRRINSQYFEII